MFEPEVKLANTLKNTWCKVLALSEHLVTAIRMKEPNYKWADNDQNAGVLETYIKAVKDISEKDEFVRAFLVLDWKVAEARYGQQFMKQICDFNSYRPKVLNLQKQYKSLQSMHAKRAT